MMNNTKTRRKATMKKARKTMRGSMKGMDLQLDIHLLRLNANVPQMVERVAFNP